MLYKTKDKVDIGDIVQHLKILRGIGFPVIKLASEGYIIFSIISFIISHLMIKNHILSVGIYLTEFSGYINI